MKGISLFILPPKRSPMGTLFTYYDGNLEDYLNYIQGLNDNRLVKIRLEAVESFHHVLDNFAVKHIKAKHANDKEELRGQIKVTDSDFLLIPDITAAFDSCVIQSPRPGRPLITYTKYYNDVEYCYVEEIRKGRRELAGVTLYKRKRKLTDAKSP